MLGRYPHQKWLQKPNRMDKDKVIEAMRITQTEAFADRITATLSGGERARDLSCYVSSTRHQIFIT